MLLLLKLTTGEEILGEVRDDNENEYIVSNPLKVIYQPKPNGRLPVVYLHQVSTFGESSAIKFSKYHVVYTAKPKKGMDKYYQDMLVELNEADKELQEDLLEALDIEKTEDTITKEEVMNIVLERLPLTGNTSVH
jgi:hypothetical protein